MRTYPAHEDLGPDPEADRTEDMRKAPVAAEAFRNHDHPNTQMEGQS